MKTFNLRPAKAVLLLFLLGLMEIGAQAQQQPELSYSTSVQVYKKGLGIPVISPTLTGSTAKGVYGRTSRVAGSGAYGLNNGNAQFASFNSPYDLVYDAAGNLFVADYNNRCIRKITPDGIVSTFAGSGTEGTADGTGAQAQFGAPIGIAIDPNGNLIVADRFNNKIRKITPSGLVSTIAGEGTAVATSFFKDISDLDVDASGNLYVADQGNHNIVKITNAGVVSVLAGSGSFGSNDGTGPAASFGWPASIDVDTAGYIYVADMSNHKIRKVSPLGVVTTLAGTGVSGFTDGQALQSQFNNPSGIVADKAGNLYVSEMGNHTVRKISTSGMVSTMAGTGTAGWSDGIGSMATFNSPCGLILDVNDNIIVADRDGNRIIKVEQGFGVQPALPKGLTLSSEGKIFGTPLEVSSVQAYSVSVHNGYGMDAFNIQLGVCGTTYFDTLVKVKSLPFSWNGITASAPGTFTDTLVNANGCDSVVTLAVVHLPNIGYGQKLQLPMGRPIGTIVPDNSGGAIPQEGYQVTTIVGPKYNEPISVTQDNIYFNDNFLEDAAGNIYFAQNNQIRKLGLDGKVTPLAGKLYEVDHVDGNDTAARFIYPTKMAWGPSGSIFICDQTRIRKMDPSGNVSTVAGTDQLLSQDGPALQSSIGGIYAMAADASGNLYFSEGSKIRRLTTGGVLETVAGSNAGYQDGNVSNALFNYVSSMVFDSEGNLILGDNISYALRKITPNGMVSTIAGGSYGDQDGSGNLAGFSFMSNMVIDAQNNIFVADVNRIRKVSPAGVVTTYVGIPTQGIQDGPYTDASINYILGMSINSSGWLHFSDNDEFGRLVFRQVNNDRSISTVFRSNADEKKNGLLRSSGLGYSSALTMGLDGQLYAVHNDGFSISLVSKDGFVKQIKLKDQSGTTLDNLLIDAIAVNGQGELFIYNSNENKIKKVSLDGVVTDFSGSGEYGSSDGTANLASFSYSNHLSFDKNGNLLMSDGNSIRRIGMNGSVSTIAGSSDAGTEDGEGIFARFNGPRGLVEGANGEIFVAEADGQKIRKISTPNLVSSFAGSGVEGSADGPAATATFSYPDYIVRDSLGNLFVTEGATNNLRKVSPQGDVTTFASQSNQAGEGDIKENNVGYISHLAKDKYDDLYYTDDYRVRKISHVGYAITPALPEGLSMDGNGVISGTPTSYAPLKSYTVIGKNQYGMDTTTFLLGVCLPTHLDTTILVKPHQLPFSWNGRSLDIGGLYQDTLANSVGCDSLITLRLQVLPEFEYPATTSFKTNEAITPLQPISTGSTIRGYFGKVGTLSGRSSMGFADGNRDQALFNSPAGVVSDVEGNVYVADKVNHAIRKIDTSGTVTTIAGSMPGSTNAFGFVDGQGTSARFSGPEGMAMDTAGNIFIADYGNNAIRKLTPDGLVSTVAGTGLSGSDDGPATSATFNLPSAVAVDSEGNIYVADTYNNKIRKVSKDGIVSTIAGTGTAGHEDGDWQVATFFNPSGIVMDDFGNLIVSELSNHQVRVIGKNGKVTTLAGNHANPGFSDGKGQEAQFLSPMDIAKDEAGNLLLADQGNLLVRKIGLDTLVSIFAGNGSSVTEDGQMLTSGFNAPKGIGLDTLNRRVLVTEFMGHNIRTIQYSGYSIDPALPQGLVLDSLGEISGTPVQASPLTTYMIIGTNAYGSDTALVSFEVLDGGAMQATLLQKTDIANCAGDSTGAITIEIAGNTGTVTYTWSRDGDEGFQSTQQNLSGVPAGLYHLLATDEAGNTASLDVELLQPDALVADAFADNAYCNGEASGYLSVSYGGGTPQLGDQPYSVLWSFGGTSDVYYDALPGVYSVKVTDDNGCVVEVAGLLVDEPPAIALSFNTTDVVCNGESNGTITLTASGGTVSGSGASAYSYLWSNGNTTANPTGLAAGTYQVSVKDDFLCSVSGSAIVSQPTVLNASVQTTATSCFGVSDGQVAVTASGGVQPYTYQLDNGSFGSLSVFTGLQKGAHTVTVKDAKGCLKQTGFQIQEPAQIIITQGVITGSCSGGATGSINITVTGGIGNLRFSWTGPNGYTSNREDPTGLAAGTYTVVVSDANNCSQSTQVIVPQLTALTVTGTVLDVACFGAATGNITLTSPITQTGLTYAWTGPNGYKSTARNIGGLRAGTYQLTITQGACSYVKSFVVSQPASALSATLTKVDITRCGGTGTINITAAGGTAPYSYSLNNGAYQLTPSFTVTTAVTFTVTVKDAKGCLFSSSIKVNDTGADAYEPNERQTTAFAYTVNSGAINARIAPAATDLDWFKFTARNQTGLTHTISVTHPTIRYTFDLYDSRGRVVAPTTSVSGVTSTKTYRTLTPGAAYALQVRGSLSFVCYQMSISDGTGIVGQASPIKNNIPSVAVGTVPSAVGPANLITEAYPNPHPGHFMLTIHSPSAGMAKVALMLPNGQTLETRNVPVRKGENKVGFTPETADGLLLYRVELNGMQSTGRVIRMR